MCEIVQELKEVARTTLHKLHHYTPNLPSVIPAVPPSHPGAERGNVAVREDASQDEYARAKKVAEEAIKGVTEALIGEEERAGQMGKYHVIEERASRRKLTVPILCLVGFSMPGRTDTGVYHGTSINVPQRRMRIPPSILERGSSRAHQLTRLFLRQLKHSSSSRTEGRQSSENGRIFAWYCT